jgi:two-component system, OmpR family, response regulator MprA
MARLLVAEDDRAVREALVRALTLEGYRVDAVADGAAALEIIRSASPDAALLDIMMPIVDGLTVCKVLRAEGLRLPILMLTARSDTGDRVAGLDAGADDYLVKPYALDELLARIRALLRRTMDLAHGEVPEVLTLGDLRIEVAARRVTRNAVEVDLTKTEFDVLEFLVRNAGIVLGQSQIYDAIWGYDFGPESKNLAVYIGYLRRKTEAHGWSRVIHTVRGVGYVARLQP